MRLGRIVCAAAVAFAGVSAALAQDPFPNVTATIFRPEGTQIGIYSPEGLVAQNASSFTRAEISPDASLILQINSAAQGGETMQYGAVNGSGPVEIAVEAGYSIISADFTPDSQYVTYTLARLEPRRFIIGFVNIANPIVENGVNKNVIEFSGVADENSAVGANKIADVLDFDGQRLLVTAFLPFTDGNFGGIYEMDVAGLDVATPGRYPMPAAIELVPGGSAINIKLSPDRKQLAFMYFDPANPPQNYQALGPAITLNTLGILDLTNRQGRIVAKAGSGQGLETMTWAPDSSRIYFTGGSYQNSYYVVTPILFSVEAPTGQVSIVATLTPNALEVVGGVRVCGSTLFFDTSVPNGGNNMSTLYSAPISNPNAARILAQGSGVALGDCVANPAG
jgi:hypothetical protein